MPQIYGELGRLPLYINRYVSIIEYWFKLILKTVYDMYMYLEDTLNDKINYSSNDNTLLSEHGFPIYGNIKVFIIITCYRHF